MTFHCIMVYPALGKPATSTTVGSETTRVAREVDRLYELSQEDRDRFVSGYFYHQVIRLPSSMILLSKTKNR